MKRKCKTEKQQALTKYLLMYGTQGYLTTHFFDHATVSTRKTLEKNRRKVISVSSLRKNI